MAGFAILPRPPRPLVKRQRNGTWLFKSRNWQGIQMAYPTLPEAMDAAYDWCMGKSLPNPRPGYPWQ